MKRFRKLTALLLAVVLVTGFFPTGAVAAETEGLTFTTTHINPLYRDVLSEEDLPAPVSSSGIQTYGVSRSSGDMEEAAAVLRDQLEARKETATAEIFLEEVTQEIFEEVAKGILDRAFDHTGVPTEGDYIRWHYSGCTISGKLAEVNGGYNLMLTYAVTYHSTAAQEAELDDAVDALLTRLDLEGASDYRKVKGVYDYICANVTYDRSSSGNLKHTAYAALVKKTAVCQGYASLLYRLLLELDVDSRVIAGEGGGDKHGWNIVELNGLYYNADSTWDAGLDTYKYFLRSTGNFGDHTRWEEYTTSAFHAEYPMDDRDYSPTACEAYGHAYSKAVTAPSCTQQGYTTYTCNGCGDSYVGDYTQAAGHSWDEGLVTRVPTETQPGEKVYTCEICEETKTEEIPVLEHTHVYIPVVTEPTCTTQGYTTYTCGCGDTYRGDEVKALGHTEVTDEAVAPTCTETGLTEGKHCSVCGAVLTEQTVVPTLAHIEVTDEAVAPTCTATGLTEGKHCSVCGTIITEQTVVPAQGHTEVTDEAVAPTCTATGLTEGKHCSVCGTIITEQTVVPALGHTEVIDEAVAATCTATGLTEGKHCSVCNEVLADQQTVPALGHSDTNKDFICDVCGEDLCTEHEVQIIPAKAATCTVDGLTEGKRCAICGEVIVSQEVVPALGHTEVTDAAVVPTCTATGLTEGKHCSVCGTVITEQTVVPALGHTEVIDEAVAATCTATGLTEGKHCSVCEAVLAEQTVIPALGHTEVIDAAVPATCTEPGKTEGSHCSICSTVLKEQEETPLAEHSWNEGVVTTEPTENEPGVMTYTCSVCGETRTEEIPCLEPALPSVQRVAGTSRVDTALEVADALKEALGVEKFDTIILANGEDKNFADALTGSYLATVKKAPILMYRTSGLSASTRTYIENNLVSGGTVYLLGGELAIPAAVEQELSVSYTVKRLAGGSRFDTNLAILEEAGVGSKEILIARGFEFADSLSASATGLPILMVNEVTGKLTDSQISFLKGLKGNKLTILGGTVAISETLQATIEGVAGREVDRVAGGSREATSVEIAKRYFDAPDFAVAAYSRKCPDGLCGGPLAYAMGAPLLLVNAGQEHYTRAYTTENAITSGYVLGGTLVITDKTAREVFGLAEDAVIEKK